MARSGSAHCGKNLTPQLQVTSIGYYCFGLGYINWSDGTQPRHLVMPEWHGQCGSLTWGHHTYSPKLYHAMNSIGWHSIQHYSEGFSSPATLVRRPSVKQAAGWLAAKNKRHINTPPESPQPPHGTPSGNEYAPCPPAQWYYQGRK
jgi:hypothetical protein